MFFTLFFSNVAYDARGGSSLCAPARVARAMASDFHANLNVAAGVVSGTLTACGSTPFAVWGALPKRRGNAGSDSELPYHLEHIPRGALGLRLLRSRSHSRSLSHSRSVQLIRLSSPHNRTRVSVPLSPLPGAPPPSSPLLLFVFVFALSSSLSYLLPHRNSFLPLHLRFFFLVFFFFVVVFFSFVSALANPCWLKPLWLPAQLLGGVDVGSRTKDLSSNVAFCCVVLRRWEWSSPAFRFHDVVSFQR